MSMTTWIRIDFFVADHNPDYYSIDKDRRFIVLKLLSRKPKSFVFKGFPHRRLHCINVIKTVNRCCFCS